jgi:hypothetical protein
MLRIGNILEIYKKHNTFQAIPLQYRVSSVLFLKHKPDQIFQAHGNTDSDKIRFHDILDQNIFERYLDLSG